MSTSTRSIVFGQGDVNGIITPLIPFNCVYDLDVGLIRFMYENGYTNNSELIDGTFFNPFIMRDIVVRLYSRLDENPLNLFMNQSADEIYNEFMSKHYEEIVRSSVHTGIYDLCSTFRTEKSVKGYIPYSNEAEYYMLRGDERLKGIEFVDLDNISTDLAEYNMFFFKSIDDMYISMFTDRIKSKSVYMLDYRFNFDENGLLKVNPNIETLEINRNTINIINVYDKQRLGMGE